MRFHCVLLEEDTVFSEADYMDTSWEPLPIPLDFSAMGSSCLAQVQPAGTWSRLGHPLTGPRAPPLTLSTHTCKLHMQGT